MVAGAERTLRTANPVVVMEVFLDREEVYRAAAGRLTSMAYHTYALDPDGGLQPIGEDWGASPYARNCMNLVFTKPLSTVER